MLRNRIMIDLSVLHKLCFALLFIFSVIFLCSCKNVKNERKDHSMLYGLTIDDAWYDDIAVEDVVEGLKNLKTRPTVRIVMSKEMEAVEYVTLFQSIKPYADIMACPVDSYEMRNFKDRGSYVQRFKDAYEHLSQYVSIWEVGNEINGTEWIKQNSEFIVDKVSAATDYIKSKGEKTALTLYCTDSPRKDMIEWAKKYISKKLADAADYCFVSYYEDENNGYHPEWKSIFKELGESFPSAFLGIGECGNIAESAIEKSKIEMAERYYGMRKPHERFIGGYFWWTWVEDCIPYQNNMLYETIRNYGR